MKTKPNTTAKKKSPPVAAATAGSAWRFEVTRWDDLETVPQPPTEYGIRCRQGRGKWMHAGKDGKLALWKTHNEANDERLRLIALKEQAQCGILGCGDSYPKAEMRTYRIGKMGVACCPECWKSMGLPPELRDTKDRCADCGKPIGQDNGPPEGWQLEDERIVCHACCVEDTKRVAERLRQNDRAVTPGATETKSK